MPTKPALLTTWASGSPSNRVATGAAKEALGWLPSRKARINALSLITGCTMSTRG